MISGVAAAASAIDLLASLTPSLKKTQAKSPAFDALTKAAETPAAPRKAGSLQSGRLAAGTMNAMLQAQSEAVRA